MTKLMLGFALGLLLGFWLSHQPAPHHLNLECSQIQIPACPQAPSCQQNPETLDSLKLHQSMLMDCYDQLGREEKELQSCRDSEVSLRGEAEDWRNRFTNECPSSNSDN
jgi:hypothetical protein